MNNKAVASTSPMSAPVIVEDDNEDEEEHEGVFHKFVAFFGKCGAHLIAFFAVFPKTVILTPWRWCQSSVLWTWNVLRKIPSYCVLHWNSEETGEEALPQTVIEPKGMAIPTGTTIPAGKSEPVKIDSKAKNQAQLASSMVDQFEEDESVVSRWWSIGIKTAAAAAAVLILIGGYFAVKTFFPVTLSDAETVALTDQTPLGDEQESSLTPQMDAGITAAAPVLSHMEMPTQKSAEPFSAPAVVSPIIAESAVPIEPATESFSAFPEPPKESSFADSASQQAFEPPKNAPLNQDPFSAASAPLAHVDPISSSSGSGPSIGDDPFGSTIPAAIAEQPTSAPAVSDPATPSALPSESAPLEQIAESPVPQPKSSVALQSLAPLETMQPMTQQLQPLAALDSPSLPPSTGFAGTAPAAVSSAANAPVAADFGERQNNRHTMTNPSFDQAPSPPAVVSTIPPTDPSPATPQTISPIAEPVKEIIPQIPHSGMVQEVPPPVVQPIVSPAAAAETAPLPAPPSESSPSIPKDSLDQGIAPEAAQPLSEESVLQFLPIDDPPIDRQLRELHKDAETEPAKLRFNAVTTTPEPALRFTPKQADTPHALAAATTDSATPANESNVLMDSAKELSDLLPSNGTGTLDPHSDDIALKLPVLENAPPPVFAEIKPAYRGAEAQGEKGMTFQKRIDSEIKRSPSETQMYTVQPGDTYMTISDHFYGTSLLYTALASHNQKSGIGWRPSEGVVIEIPTADYLQTHYGDAARRQERRLEAQRSAIRYVVQEGDTIFRLAMDKLQDSTRWREIYALNTDRIQDVRDLKPGTEILLPAESIRRN